MKKTFQFNATAMIEADPKYKMYFIKGDITSQGCDSEQCEKKAWERLYDALVSIGKPQILLDKGRVVDDGAPLIINIKYRHTQK